jgi:hypothetical protein
MSLGIRMTPPAARRGFMSVRRGKVLLFSGCETRPANCRNQPVAVRALVEVTIP